MLAVSAGLTIGPATASPTQQATSNASACGLTLGSVTAGGDHVVQRITATNTPTVGAKTVTPNLYADGAARLSSRWHIGERSTGTGRGGWVVLGDALYRQGYYTTASGAFDPQLGGGIVRIGGGWSRFTYFESSKFWYDSDHLRIDQYGLRNDGVLFRWHLKQTRYWVSTGSAPGFAAVKSMALISKTPTYDMFLANTRGGGLYTIRIPLTSPMKPVVTKIRSATWQNFETLIAARCRDDSTVFVGIDKDKKTGYAYVMSHAQGAGTRIYGLGKVPLTFKDPVYFPWVPGTEIDPLSGG
jgi:hypothetical protein